MAQDSVDQETLEGLGLVKAPPRRHPMVEGRRTQDGESLWACASLGLPLIKPLTLSYGPHLHVSPKPKGVNGVVASRMVILGSRRTIGRWILVRYPSIPGAVPLKGLWLLDLLVASWLTT